MSTKEITEIIETYKQAVLKMVEVSVREDAVKLEKIKARSELCRARNELSEIKF